MSIQNTLEPYRSQSTPQKTLVDLLVKSIKIKRNAFMGTNSPQKTHSQISKDGDTVKSALEDATEKGIQHEEKKVLPTRELFIFPTRAKKPLTPRGFHNARLESQWTGKESTQWGAPCGEKNGFMVIDIDVKGDGLETAKTLDFSDTLIVQTPSGGFHAYYQYDNRSKNLKTTVGVLPGIDIRNDGSYVVIYDHIDRSRIQTIPEPLLKALSSAKRAPNIKASLSEAAEGGRNQHLTRKAGKMQRLGVLTLEALSELNERECNPPLEDTEVRLIFESISRYAPEPEDEAEGSPEATVQDLVAPMIEYLSNPNVVKGESTGIEHLDSLLGGGKRLGELSVMLAEAKSGKNTFWHYQMVHMLDRGIACAYASRELDPASEVLPNLVTLAQGKNAYKHGHDEAQILERIKSWKLVFSEGLGQYNDVSELFIWLENKISEGIKFLWIDHLHFCLPDSEDFKSVSNFIRELRKIARSRMVHIDLIIQPKGGTTQFNRSGKIFDNDLDVGQLRGGAALGQALDNLITMQRVRDEDGDKTDVSKISLKSARNKLAKLGSFYAAYDRDTMRFSEVSKPSDPVTEERGENRYHRAAKRNRTTKDPKDVPVFDLSQNGFNLRKGL